MKNNVTILLSTYNGEKYLRYQLDSIYNQTFKDFLIIARDDGSKDKTVDILQEYKEKYGKMEIILGDNLGPYKSFLYLLKNAGESNYYSFCDQDDIWDINKIEKSINQIESCENKDDIPILINTNYRYINYKGEFIRIKNKYKRPSYGNHLLQVNGLGCTFMFNKLLKEQVLKTKLPDISMHDAIVMKVAATFGIVIYIDQPTMSYRQHDSNVIGSKKNKFKFLKNRFNAFKRSFSKRYSLRIKSFYDNIKHLEISKEKEDIIFLAINYKDSFKFWMKLLFTNIFTMQTTIQTIHLKLLILLRLF